MSYLVPLLLALSQSTDAARRGIWIDRSELMALPMSGPAWEAVLDASGGTRPLDLSNQDDDADTELLATAYVGVRTGNQALQDRVHAAIDAAMGTEDGGRTLALGRNLQSLVIAADLVEHRDPAFCQWLRDVMRETLDGKTLISTHEGRGNNWFSHAGAARLLADWFLFKWAPTPAMRREAQQDGFQAVAVWRGWLGDRSVYADFQWGELYWQSDPSHPVGINPRGATIQGHNVDGVLPDDQRRSGPFTWPAPRENYVWEALQGTTVAVMVMQRCKYPGPAVLGWSDAAHQRAIEWLYGPNFAPAGADGHTNFPPEGDDLFLVPLINRLYGLDFPVTSPAQGGKGMAFTDWTHSP